MKQNNGIQKNNSAAEYLENVKKVSQRIMDGSIFEQKAWSHIVERCSVFEENENKIALIDCTREYTYKQLFDEWDRYAKVFTGLGITSENKSRVAIGGTITAEPIFCFYGLNMTGAGVSMFSYPDFLPSGNWKNMIKAEHITDLILSDIVVTPSAFKQILKVKSELGLRHVLLIHSKMGGPTLGPAELIYNEVNYHLIKRIPGAVFIDDLFDEYGDTPIYYGKYKADEIAIIGHTSGTTKGTRKPIPYSEKTVNTSSIMHLRFSDETELEQLFLSKKEQVRSLLLFDYSSAQGFLGWVNEQFCLGDISVLTFFGFLHPKYAKAIEYYKINQFITSGFIFDKWLENESLNDLDMSSVRAVLTVGSYITPENLKIYNTFLKEHGCNCAIVRLYGMSELTGNGFTTFSEEDELGFCQDKKHVRILDEDDNKFYAPDDGPRTGILYLHSKAMSSNVLDGETLYDYIVIDGEEYLCTNDLIHIREDGHAVYVGRADKYFVNNAGKRFESGIVDAQMMLHQNIDKCAVVPVFEKRIHDTIPVLYVVPAEDGAGAEERIRQALVDVYIKDKTVEKKNLPLQFMIVDNIPTNSNGKLDIYKITRERLQGIAYNILPVHKADKLADIKIERVEEMSSMVSGADLGDLGKDSAFNIFELFN